MRFYYEKDTDLSIIRGRKVAVIGFGNQGAAQAMNLRDSGVAELAVALRPDSSSRQRAQSERLRILDVPEAARWADVMLMTVPDELQGALYASDLAPNLRAGTALVFAHGFSIHFKVVEPRPDLDIVMVAPKGQGRAVRSEYVRGGGLPCLFAVHQDASGNAHALGLSYAAAIGAGRSAIMETTFGEECESDMFSEQVVLCGGLTELIRAAFETLVEAGYSPEVAYFECLHEVKIIADLVHERGIAGMNKAISGTAEYGEYVAGPRVVDDRVRAEMRRVLADIRSGKFARDWMTENKAGLPLFKKRRAEAAAHPIEEVGARMRALMPWLSKR